MSQCSPCGHWLWLTVIVPGGVTGAVPPADVEPHVAVPLLCQPERQQAAGLHQDRRLAVAAAEREVAVPAHVGGGGEHARLGPRGRGRCRVAAATRGAVTGEVLAGGGDAAVDADADAPFAREPEDTSTTVWLESAARITPITVPVTVTRGCDPLLLGEQSPAAAGEAERECLVLSGGQTGRGVTRAWPPAPFACASSASRQPSAFGEQRTGRAPRPLRQLARPTAVSPLETSGLEGGIVTNELVADALPPPLVVVTLHCRCPPLSTPRAV